MDFDSSNEQDSNEDSSSSSEDDENQLEKRANKLEAQVTSNKYLYDVHLKLIDVYGTLADLNSLRQAYDRFSRVYPLTPTIWLNWLRIEMNLAETNEAKLDVLKIFERAVDDYQSIELWLEYVQYAIGVCTKEEVRLIFEKGLSMVGLNVKEGHLLWDNLREFELIHLGVTKGNESEEEIQLNRLIDIFKRQLSIPLVNMEDTWLEFQEYVVKYPTVENVRQTIEYVYKKALKQLNDYQSYENELLVEEDVTRRLNVFKEYVKNVKEPMLINNIYERALVENALNGELWNDYCRQVLNLNLGVVVSDRAIRNCPWHEDLWVTRIRIFEYEGKSEEEIMKAFEEGVQWITCGIDLWLTYLEYLRRNVGIEKFVKVYEQFDVDRDVSCQLMRYAARIYANNQRADVARKIWTNIVYRLGKTANVYLEYLAFERQFGDVKSVRVLMQKAINSCTDYPECLAEEWLMYEREFGTLNDVISCENKCKLFKMRTGTSNKVETSKRGEAFKQTGTSNPRAASKQAEASKRRERYEFKDQTRKRFMPIERSDAESKRGKFEFDSKEIDDEQFHRQSSNYDPNLTVFVSNLSYTVDEKQLKEFFPNAVNIYKPNDRKGKSRGFAYCTFKTPEEVAVALSRDRERLEDRPVFVSECKPDRTQRQTTFKYSTDIERNKLFVRGLPFVCDQDAVVNIFKPYGAINVRLVTKKNGQSKGCAYVDFHDEEAAGKALKETDGLRIGEHTIVVAISKPPQQQQNRDENDSMTWTRNSKTKLNVPLIPRGVQLKAREETKTNIEKEIVKKTNEDFRKMLLNPSKLSQ